ncbi:PD-(D/E)XK nuclease domain-containing protein, partial [Cylindrospermopsis raciborskii]
YDILLFISEGMRFRNYWFETGSPSFLLKLFQKERYFLPNLEGIQVTEEILDSFDVEQINPVTLLFQSGYLTIKDTFTDINQIVFCLGIPNMEVKIALNNQFINAYTKLVNEKLGVQRLIHTQLSSGDVEGLVSTIKRLFASIPWRNFTNNDLADFEGYYTSVIYAFLSSLDARVIPEDITNHGQSDLTVMVGGHIYVMEIKVVEGNQVQDNAALDQILQRNYAEKYRGEPGKSVHEIGLIFSRSQRNLIQANWQ